MELVGEIADLEYRARPRPDKPSRESLELLAPRAPRATVYSGASGVEREKKSLQGGGGGGSGLGGPGGSAATAHVEVQGEPNYTYSKNFGAKFSGYGVGLPMARLYARVAGGDVGISCLPGHGTDATLIINRLGTSSIPLG